MGFSPTYSTGGELDRVKKIGILEKIDKVAQVDKVLVVDEVKKIHFPDHLFPSLSKPFTKGFRMEIPPLPGEYVFSYVAPVDLELIDVGVACSGYADSDYWELALGPEKIIETMYTKELAQHINMGTSLYTISKIPAGMSVGFSFFNDSATAKTVWFDFRFLK